MFAGQSPQVEGVQWTQGFAGQVRHPKQAWRDCQDVDFKGNKLVKYSSSQLASRSL